MSRARIAAWMSLSMGGLLAAPAYAQDAYPADPSSALPPAPYAGRVLSWPGKTQPGARAWRAPSQAPVGSYLVTPPTTAQGRWQAAPSRPAQDWTYAPSTRSALSAPQRAASVESRYGPARPAPAQPVWTPPPAEASAWPPPRLATPARASQAQASRPLPPPPAPRQLAAAPPPAAARVAPADTAPWTAAAQAPVRRPPAPAAARPAAAMPAPALASAAPVRSAPAPVVQPPRRAAMGAASNQPPPAAQVASAPASSLMAPPSHPWNERFASPLPPLPEAKAQTVAKAKASRPAKAAKAAPAQRSRPVQTAQASPVPAPAPGAASVRFYSVHRDFGIQPTPAPIPPQFFGPTPDLSEAEGPQAIPAQTTGKGALAARARAEADTSTPD